MECCYVDDCDGYSVRPILVAPCSPGKCCDEVPACFPCIPRCTRKVICCEKPRPRAPLRKAAHCDLHEYDCCHSGEDDRHHSKDYDCCHVRKHSPRPRAHDHYHTSSSHDTCYAPPQRCESDYSPCKPVKTKYVIPCYRYEDGRIVRQLPVTAFKRNGMQDQEHSKIMGTANFLTRCPRDVCVECEVCANPIKANQPTLLMRRACEVAIGARPRKKPFVESCFLADSDHQETRYIREDERGNCCYHFEKTNYCHDQCLPLHPRPCRPCVPCHSSPECQYTNCVVTGPCGGYYC